MNPLKCFNEYITSMNMNYHLSIFRFLISFSISISLFFVIFLILGYLIKQSIVWALGISIIFETLLQIIFYYWNWSDERVTLKENWKMVPPQAKKVSLCNCYFPESIKLRIFWIKTRITEPVLMYHIISNFVYMRRGWNAAMINDEFNSDNDHDAIVISIYSKYGREYFFKEGIDLLITFFVKHKISFKVYLCQNSNDFISVLNNPKTKTLWIFGHGARGLLACQDTKLEYSKVVNLLSNESKNKNYVYQFHCNNGNEKSLADFLSEGEGFVNNKVNTLGSCRGYIKAILNDSSWNSLNEKQHQKKCADRDSNPSLGVGNA